MNAQFTLTPMQHLWFTHRGAFLLPCLKDELQTMEKQEIIVNVTEPTEWVSSMVAAEKQAQAN